jgi:hypothetical protein
MGFGCNRAKPNFNVRRSSWLHAHAYPDLRRWLHRIGAMGNRGDSRRSGKSGAMKSEPYPLGRIEPRASDRALAERPETVEIVHTVLTRFQRKGRILGLPDGPQLWRVATAEYHRG